MPKDIDMSEEEVAVSREEEMRMPFCATVSFAPLCNVHEYR